MRYVGVDLHKQSIRLCVVELANREREVVQRRRFRCDQVDEMEKYFASLGEYQLVVEATASYEWFVRLVEPTADRVVLAHPAHLRVIAQSKRKTDKLDAQTLAEFLALDQIPEAWRPTPRVREHRGLVRHRNYVVRRNTSVKNKLRRVLSHYNADVSNLFTEAGREYLAMIKLSEADRFVTDQLCEELDQHSARLKAVDKQLREFAKAAPVAEQEAEHRAVLASMPCVGPVTIDVVLAEAGDVRRFGSQRKATAYAGLAPGIRESAGRSKQLGITKEGSRLLRAILVETAWRLVLRTRRWSSVPSYEDFGVVNRSERILLMIDEAHRTQSGDMGDNLFEAFPQATRLAFTGTPLIAVKDGQIIGERTAKRFGGYIDKYKLQDAVEDGATVQILYEGKTAESAISRKDEFDTKVDAAARKQLVANVIDQLQTTIDIIDFWNRPTEVSRLRGQLSDLMLATGIDEVIQYSDKLVTEITQLAKTRERDILR